MFVKSASSMRVRGDKALAVTPDRWSRCSHWTALQGWSCEVRQHQGPGCQMSVQHGRRTQAQRHLVTCGRRSLDESSASIVLPSFFAFQSVSSATRTSCRTSTSLWASTVSGSHASTAAMAQIAFKLRVGEGACEADFGCREPRDCERSCYQCLNAR